MGDLYPELTRAGLTQNYLHTNSTTHEFLFGALAELLDNARDAAATKIDVSSVVKPNLRGGFMLSFLDDGEGMDPSDVANIVQFGKSFKRNASDHMIGQYGNGLKSGSMRIGNDFILFTKKGHDLSCLMLSRTFHDHENIDSIIVPMPVWDTDTRRPNYKHGGRERFETEMKLILKYSPFKSEKEVVRQFERIKDRTGTLIIIYNLKLLDSGEPELDIKTDPTDIRMSEMDPEDDSNWPERVSFKAYASILYLDPRMKVYVQGKKIRTKRLACTLYKPRMYKFSSARFKKRSEEEVMKAEQEYRIAEEKAREAESVSRDLERKVTMKANPRKEELIELRVAQDKAVGMRKMCSSKRDSANFKKKALKDKKSLDFVFGFNLENRKYYGMFIYNCSRLIRMYERVGPQNNGGMNCAGVIGVVNVPYLVLEPTHNKQHFADNKEFRHLLKAMGDHLQCYWRDSKVSAGKGVLGFWESFGYLSDSWGDPPSDDPKYERARTIRIPKVIQCDACLKWRTLPFQSNMVGKDPPSNWICSMNPDLKHNKCQCPEETSQIPIGEFQKETKTVEQKRTDLEDKMEKMQREYEKVAKLQTVTSSRDAVSKFSSSSGRRRRIFSGDSSDFSSDDNEPSSSSSNKFLTQDSRMSSTSVGFKRRSVDGQRTVAKKSASFTPTSNSNSHFPRKRTKLSTDFSDSDGDMGMDDAKGTDIGAAVEVSISDKWRPGTVVSTRVVKGQPTKYKVKFDQHPQDRFDKWCEDGSSDFRFVSNSELVSNGTPSKPRRQSLPEPSAATKVNQKQMELHENALGKLRTCLRYFLPPQWKMPKEEINNLTLQELVDFPMDDFFDHYEKGLRRLVSNFRTQADQQRAAAESAKTELAETQQMLYEVLTKFDKETPNMTHDEVGPYTRRYLDNTT
uniref:MORC family CW-type zinc finger protein 2 n=1 Tax=Phallusia mammillata TaxID=59560 RepID=A0A6F9DLR1_9ASCI|nr:MORC family CW-type zinc finger protein 2 [Phallusia mammillata]